MNWTETLPQGYRRFDPTKPNLGRTATFQDFLLYEAPASKPLSSLLEHLLQVKGTSEAPPKRPARCPFYTESIGIHFHYLLSQHNAYENMPNFAVHQ